MKKQILLISLLVITSVQIAKSQCGVSPSTYLGAGTTTVNRIPVFNNATGCIQNSQITDNGTDVIIGTGSVNVNATAQSYMINGLPVLRHGGSTTNIFVGVGAGISVTSGTSNTFVGHNAGFTNTQLSRASCS